MLESQVEVEVEVELEVELEVEVEADFNKLAVEDPVVVVAAAV